MSVSVPQKPAQKTLLVGGGSPKKAAELCMDPDDSFTSEALAKNQLRPARLRPMPMLTGPMPKSSIGLAGLQWPMFVGPTSHVIKAPKDWCDRGILLPHEAFRWLHGEIRKILTYFDPLVPGQDWQTSLFFSWLERYYILAVRHHHDSEERIYNPAIIGKGGSLPAKITSDHKDIIARLNSCSKFRSRIENGEEIAVVKFKNHLTQLIDMIEDHLAEEESAYPEALRSSGMTEADEELVVEKIIQDLGLDGNKVLLPPIIYAMHMWAGREAAEAMVNTQLPPQIKFALTHFWIRDFQVNSLGVISSLQGMVPFQGSPQCTTPCIVCAVQ